MIAESFPPVPTACLYPSPSTMLYRIPSSRKCMPMFREYIPLFRKDLPLFCNYMPSSRNRFRFVRPSLQSCPSSNAASGTVPSHSQRDVKARQRIRAAHKRARMCERGPCDVKARTASRIGAEGWCTLPAPGAVRARCKLVGLICQDFVSLPLPTIQRSHEGRDSPYGYTRSVHHSAVLSGADVAAGRAQSRCRCGRGGPSPGADVAGAH